MIQAGRRGQTAEQIAKVLHLPADSGSAHRALACCTAEWWRAGPDSRRQAHVGQFPVGRQKLQRLAGIPRDDAGSIPVHRQ